MAEDAGVALPMRRQPPRAASAAEPAFRCRKPRWCHAHASHASSMHPPPSLVVAHAKLLRQVQREGAREAEVVVRLQHLEHKHDPQVAAAGAQDSGCGQAATAAAGDGGSRWQCPRVGRAVGGLRSVACSAPASGQRGSEREVKGGLLSASQLHHSPRRALEACEAIASLRPGRPSGGPNAQHSRRALQVLPPLLSRASLVTQSIGRDSDARSPRCLPQMGLPAAGVRGALALSAAAGCLGPV